MSTDVKYKRPLPRRTFSDAIILIRRHDDVTKELYRSCYIVGFELCNEPRKSHYRIGLKHHKQYYFVASTESRASDSRYEYRAVDVRGA